VGVKKKGSGGFPIEFLCSQIYNFWGFLITADEQQRPANEVRAKKNQRALDFRVEVNTCVIFPFSLR